MVTSLLWRLAEGTLLILQSFSTLPLTLPPCYPAKDLSGVFVSGLGEACVVTATEGLKVWFPVSPSPTQVHLANRDTT